MTAWTRKRVRVRHPGRHLLWAGMALGALVSGWAAPVRAQTHAAQSIVNVAHASGFDAQGNPLAASGRAETAVDLLAHAVLRAGMSADVRPGTAIDLPHVLVNGGNYTESFVISVQSAAGWSLGVVTAAGTHPTPASFTLGPLAPGDSMAIMVHVECPPAANAGDTDVITVTAHSSRVPQDVARVQDDLRCVQAVLDPFRLSVEPAGIVPPGATLTYRLEIGNPDTESPLEGLVLEDPFDPAIAELIEATSGPLTDAASPGRAIGVQAEFDAVTHGLTWRCTSLPPGFRGTLTLTARLAPAMPGGGRIANEVFATATGLPRRGSGAVSTSVVPPSLELRLSAEPPDVEPGDAVLYQIEARNPAGGTPLDSVWVDVRLPAGFRFVDGGGRNAQLLAAHLEAGTSQVWTLEGATALTLTSGVQSATASARCKALDEVPLQAAAQAPVHVTRRLGFEGTIVGRVYVDEDSSRAPDAFEGLPGVRLLLEDGTQTVTDARGRFHLEGVRPGLHVLRLDTHGLPRELRFDTEGRLAAGSDWTRFVDVGPSELRKVNFRARTAPGSLPRRYEIAAGRETWRFYEFSLFEPGSDTLRPAAARLLRGLGREDSLQIAPARVRCIAAAGDTLSAPADVRQLALERALAVDGMGPEPEDAAPAPPEVPLEKQVLSMTPEPAILSPAMGAVCSTDHPSVLVKFPIGSQPKLFVNGSEVSEARVGMRLEAPAQGLACWRYVSVPVLAGRNYFVLESDSAGVAFRDTVWAALPGPPARIDLTADSAPADGQTAPHVRVRVLDSAGLPAAGTLFVTVEPAECVVGADADPQADGLQIRLLNSVADLELAPGARAGTRRVQVRSGGLMSAVDVTLKPAPRDWLVSGVGTVSVGARAADAASLPGETPRGVDAKGGVLAEGRVGRDGQLAVMVRGDQPGEALFGTHDEDRLFPAWGDAAAYTATAPSTWPVFARLDLPSARAQIGDFRTGWNDLELARFDRALTGFDGGWNPAGGRTQVQAFAAAARQSGCRDDLPGRGLAGPYVLSRRPIRVHSERLTVEVRDRFHPDRILESRPLGPDRDYTIDFVHGLIYLKDVLPSADANWNPMRLVALYEAESEGPEEPLAGVRAAFTPAAGLRTGLLGVHESSPLGARTLVGGDAQWSPAAGTTLAGEYARSAGIATDAAWRASLETRLGPGRAARVSYREIGPQFDNTTGPAAADIGLRRYGLDVHAQVGAGRLVVDAAAQQDLRRGSMEQRVATDYARDVHGVATAFGYRVTHTGGAAGERVAHVLAGRARRQLHARFGLETGFQQALGAPVASDPTRLSVGADLGLTSKASLRLRQEWDGSGTGRRATSLGLESRVGGQTAVTSGLEQLAGPGGDRTAARLGIRTAVAVGHGWSVRGSLEHGRVLTEADETSTALSGGATWRGARRLAALEYEHAAGTGSSQDAVRFGGSARLGADWMLLGRERFLRAAFGPTVRNGHDLLVGWAYRPVGRDEIQALTSVRYLSNAGPLESPGLAAARLVLGSQASADLAARWTLLGGLGVRRSVVSTGGTAARATALLAHARLLCDIAPRFDLSVGVRRRSATQSAADWSAGFESGYRLAKDLWLAAGYNVVGFADPDFPERERTAPGGFATLRVKFDERSFGIQPLHE